MAKNTLPKKKLPKKPPVAIPVKPKVSYEKWFWIGIILVLTFISFYPSLRAEFTNWDDNVYLNENKLLTSLSLDNIERIFSPQHFVSLNYHPLTILSLAVDYHFSKLQPFRYHLVNLLLHLANTLFVFFLAYKLSRKKIFVAAFTALFFGIHPMHVESVAWVAERKDVLYSFFFVAGLITYLLYNETKKRAFIVITFFLFVLSVLSKAMAVVFPLVLLLIDYYQGRKISWKTLAEKLPFLVISLAAGWLALHIQSQKAIAAYEVFSLYNRISFGFYGLATYVWKMFIPAHLSAYYPYPLTDIYGKIPLSFYLVALSGLLALAAVVVFTFWKKKQMKLITFGAFFFLITIIMVLQFLSVGTVIMADRYSYVPYIGLFFVSGMLLYNLTERKQAFKIPVIILTGIVAIIFSFLTHERTEVWKNSETLWTDVQQKYPFPPWKVEVAYENRGNYYAKEHNELDKGLADYNMLLQMKTANSNIYKNIGNIYGLKGQEAAKEGNTEKVKAYSDKAIYYYTTGIALNPKDPDIYINLAITYSDINLHDSAAACYAKALLLQPDNINLIERQALEYFNAGNIKSASNDFSILTQQDPNNAAAWFNLSACHYNLGDHAAALAEALKAQSLGFKLDPDYINKLKLTVKGKKDIGK